MNILEKIENKYVRKIIGIFLLFPFWYIIGIIILQRFPTFEEFCSILLLIFALSFTGYLFFIGLKHIFED